MTLARMSSRGVKLAICAVTALALLIIAAVTFFVAPPQPAEGAADDLPRDGEFGYPWMDYETSYAPIWEDMNKALQTKDRELFLAHAEGAALDQLGLWWDNMAAIGFTTGYVEPFGSSLATDISIGVDLGFSASPLRGSGKADSGLVIPLGQQYTVTTAGDDDDVTISSFTPAGTPNPWDSGRLYVQKREHVVVYGLEDERALVDSTVEEAEKAAVKLLELATSWGSDVPQRGFISAVTASEERLQSWYDSDHGLSEPAGFAQGSGRPSAPTAIMDPTVATGAGQGGWNVVIGPGAAGDYGRVFVHEFAHVLHGNAAGPSLLSLTATREGFARYVEWTSGYSEFRPSRALKDEVRARGAAVLADDYIYNDDTAHIGYEAAGSYYLFVADSGGDPWELALKSGFVLELDAQTIDPAFSPENWMSWMEKQ